MKWARRNVRLIRSRQQLTRRGIRQSRFNPRLYRRMPKFIRHSQRGRRVQPLWLIRPLKRPKPQSQQYLLLRRQRIQSQRNLPLRRLNPLSKQPLPLRRIKPQAQLNLQRGKRRQNLLPNLQRGRRVHQSMDQRKKFFSPIDLLRFAPIQDIGLWKLIVSRLPSDYVIPDPAFMNIFRSSK